MPQSIKAVVEERHSDSDLRGDLGPDRPRRNGRDHRWRLEMPSERGSSEVRESKDVESSAENDRCVTVDCGAVPGDLGLIDS
jgi:hypothetical protein